uniref:S41 family peptidase n=4 Tax=Roseivirga sp. TaxID=1964215 RepID=UPI004048A66E
MKQPRLLLTLLFCLWLTPQIQAQGTRLLRQPTISDQHIVFTYGGDLWRTDLEGKNLMRLTSTPAIESDPHLSPDGRTIAFTSNRSGSTAVYTIPVSGGTPKRLTWHPAGATTRGWTPNGMSILYASSRESAPTPINHLWTVDKEGGPSNQLTAQWGNDGSFSPNGKQIVIDKMSRWESEFRNYKGGQNTPLIILDLNSQSETLIPNEKTIDIHPVWMDGTIYFLSDRDWIMNVWAYDVKSANLRQVTQFKNTDIKWLAKSKDGLMIEHDGYLHKLNPANGQLEQMNINIVGDFPWAETQWENVSSRARSVSLSPSGKRAIMEARGEIFTVPTEFGDPRNITQSSGTADRAPIWSPNGDQIAWFSDASGKGYALHIANQDGLSPAESIAIGESKMAWEPTWSPDGKKIAFVDDDVRIRIIDLATKTVSTADIGGNNLERGSTGITWSPDSKYLAYAKSGVNNFRRIMVWSSEDKSIKALTNELADSFSPAWDADGKHFYFLASTDVALGSGWANTSSITANPAYGAYVIILRNDVASPFIPRSDEEEVKKTETEEKKEKEPKKEEQTATRIDIDGIERRTIALPLPIANYISTLGGIKEGVFISESKPGARGLTLHKFTLEKREADEFLTDVGQHSISADGKKLLVQVNGSWQVTNTAGASGKGGKAFKVDLQMKLDRAAEWKQMFEEAWRYEKDYFYDPNLHGRDWQEVYERYAPLVPFVKHRSDLNYILDQMNGELSVGHSFVRGGDFPSTDRSQVGLLGADLIADKNHWKIERIFTTESWNPGLTSPLDRPGMKVKTGYYLVGINGKELTTNTDPYEMLDGTLGQQTVLHINEKPSFEGAWKEIAEPIGSENALRQRAWVEDNRRRVDELSNGKLGYIWVPNTGGPGYVSFNRYFFAQQHKEGAVIDERFNGGGLLDDYMVDLMTRSLRAGLTNEVPNGQAFKLPAGILGPKVLLINEMAGSGGDFFPWVFRQQKAGLLIGASTWGGLVKSSTHYALIDGGSLTAPDNAVFDPINNEWVAENKGVAPDIAVRQDTKALSQGKDPQLERAVQELLRLLKENPTKAVTPPPFLTPAKKGN